MNRVPLLLVVVCLIFSVRTGIAADSPAQAKYNELVKRALAGDRTVDLAELRRMAGDAGIESDPDARGELMKAAGRRDFAAMKNTSAIVLKGNFADLDAHYFAKIAARELGNEADADFHHWAEMGLLNALRATGDGRSAETAMKVISVSEEYFIIRVMGQIPKQQSLGKCSGNPCDIYVATDRETNREMTWYFNIAIPMSRLGDALGRPAPLRKKR